MATYRHKMVNRFRIGRFEFKNFILNINEKKDPGGVEEFERLVNNMPHREKIQIVVIDEKALASLERPMTRGVRGVMSTGHVPSPTVEGSLAKLEDERAREAEAKAELERLAEEKAKQDASDAAEKQRQEESANKASGAGEAQVTGAANPLKQFNIKQ